jgi:hypothetical protein
MEINNADIAVMTTWLDVSADFTQLALASLVLPIVCIKIYLGVPDGQSVRKYLNTFLYCSWVSLFISIALGMLYQEVATCNIGSHLVGRAAFACKFSASVVFTVSTMSLLIGVALFIIGAIRASGEYS